MPGRLEVALPSAGLEAVQFEPVYAAETEEPDNQRALLHLADQSLRKMTKRQKQRLFPADELGIPLSIYVPDSYRDDVGRLDQNKHKVNKHHRFAPKKFLIHKHGELGKILRYSCLQFVPVELHDEFNKSYDQPLLPVTQLTKFGAIILSVARYLPAEAIDVSNGSPRKRELSLAERQLIWSNNELRPEQGSKVQDAILRYVVSQDINGVDERLVEEFLTTLDDETRVARGKQLFRIAAEVAVEPIEQRYVEAWEGGLLPRQDLGQTPARVLDIHQARAVPKDPKKFIARHVGRSQYAMNRTLSRLRDNLEERYMEERKAA